ncbi:MAG: LamG domain-containing protein [Spirochaetota bacterium]|nr:LamG domain-containing protein [Spirochaetota bacterium]
MFTARDLASIETGWLPLSDTFSITDEDTISATGKDLTSIFEKGVKVKGVRDVVAQVYSLDLESTSSQFAYIADNASLSITGDMTIEGWKRFESDVSAPIVSKYGAAGQRSYLFRYSSSQLQFTISVDGTAATTAAVTFVPTLGIDYHFAVSYNASAGTCIFYVNGISIGTGSSLATSIFDSTTNFELGAISVLSSYSDGLQKETRLWNVVRTATEIRQNMAKVLTGAETGLVGCWSLENVYTDVSGNGNTLTPSGSPVFASDVPDLLNQTDFFFYCIGSSFSTDTTISLIQDLYDWIPDDTMTWSYSRIEIPEGFPDLFNFTPVVTASGSMTFTITSIITRKFKITGKTLKMFVRIYGTTGGTASNTIIIEIPVAISSDMAGLSNSCMIDDAAGFTGFLWHNTGLLLYARKYTEANFGLGTNRRLTFQYEYGI